MFVGIRWIVGLWSEYLWTLMESFLNLIMHACYSFVFISDLSVWFDQLDWFIFSGSGALWWVQSCGALYLVKEGDKTRICIVVIKGKIMEFIHIGWVYSVYIMSSCLRRYSVFHELNTIDAWWIAVDWWSSSSRCRQESVYLSRTWCLYTWSLPWSSWLFAFLSIAQQ